MNTNAFKKKQQEKPKMNAVKAGTDQLENRI